MSNRSIERAADAEYAGGDAAGAAATAATAGAVAAAAASAGDRDASSSLPAAGACSSRASPSTLARVGGLERDRVEVKRGVERGEGDARAPPVAANSPGAPAASASTASSAATAAIEIAATAAATTAAGVSGFAARAGLGRPAARRERAELVRSGARCAAGAVGPVSKCASPLVR